MEGHPGPFRPTGIRTVGEAGSQVTRIVGMTAHLDASYHLVSDKVIFWQRGATGGIESTEITPSVILEVATPAIGATGKVAGGCLDATGWHAFVWGAETGRQDLDVLARYPSGTTLPWAEVNDINDKGQMLVDASDANDVGRAWLVENGAWTEISLDSLYDQPVTAGGYVNSWLNNRGQVAGRIYVWWPSTNSYSYDGFVCDAVSGMKALYTLGGNQPTVSGINDAGLIIGYAEITPDTYDFSACTWDASLNTTPVLTVPASVGGVVGTVMTFTATATDPDIPTNTLTFSLVDAPDNSGIQPTTGAFTWTPSTAGPVTFDVSVSDGLLSSTKPVTVNVAAAPASVLEISNVTLTRKRKTVSVTVKATAMNNNRTSALNTQLDTATLGAITTATALPLRIGTIRPGASKSITVLFRNAPPGPATLTIHGTCSLVSFGTVQQVIVP